jgi:hypothetical protein
LERCGWHPGAIIEDADDLALVLIVLNRDGDHARSRFNCIVDQFGEGVGWRAIPRVANGIDERRQGHDRVPRERFPRGRDHRIPAFLHD